MKIITNLQDLAEYRAYGIHPDIPVTPDEEVCVWHDQDGQYYFVNTMERPTPDFNTIVSLNTEVNIPIGNWGIVPISNLII